MFSPAAGRHLCEVVNGAAGYGNVAVGIPTGTGNDFVRNFSDGGQFFDIGAQLDGSVISADLIRANGKFCVNMINVGFDSETVANTAFFRQKFFLPNRLAYTFAMLVTLIKKPGVRMEISVDGKTDESLSLLLCTFANGAYCGGGYKSNPNAHPADGSIDCLLVNNVSRLKFLSLVGQYKKGEHLNDKTKDILKNVNFRSAVIDFGKTRNISIDGELITADRLNLEIAPDALRFVLPRGATPKFAQKNTACASVI